ncbi:MAG: tRNA preQ1(34) S-adenosylmethionine ribosyltransferase-isomerase QueA [Alphaproteobacteria bacterium]
MSDGRSSEASADAPLPIEAFDFVLPPERIAQAPARPRDAARLLWIGRRELADRAVRELPELLRPGDLLVLNDTKVIPARLSATRRGAKVELTLHRQLGAGTWRAFARPARKLSVGDRVEIAPDFAAEVTEKGSEGEVTLRFECGGSALLAALERHGMAPLPPYIKRRAGALPADRADYQTIYAREAGAVAAPTAGLHFTEALLAALEARGVGRAMLTLHVGAGTFLPVKVADVRRHPMQGEYGVIPKETAARVNAARARGGRIIAVGSTSLRLLESAADASGRIHPFAGETRLFILPGYRFRAVDLMLTNFHLPRSTLFVLVAAFAGLERMRAAYAHAIAAGYRFYSYGDCCLIERAEDGTTEAAP